MLDISNPNISIYRIKRNISSFDLTRCAVHLHFLSSTVRSISFNSVGADPPIAPFISSGDSYHIPFHRFCSDPQLL